MSFAQSLYAANPYAVKDPDAAAIAFWENFHTIHGDATTIATFNKNVGDLTGNYWEPGATVANQVSQVLPLVLVGVAVWLFLKRRKGKTK